MADEWYPVLMIPPLFFARGPDGWQYAEVLQRVPRPGDPPPPPTKFYGPFNDPESAARDFAERLGERYPDHRMSLEFVEEIPGMTPPHSDELRALAVAIDAAMVARKQRK